MCHVPQLVMRNNTSGSMKRLVATSDTGRGIFFFQETFLDKRFIRFLLVGGINTLFGYSVFALFIFLKFHYSLAVLFGTILGILFNFKTTGKMVFNNTDNALLFKFVGVYTATFLINVACLKVFDVFKINMFLAGAFLILPVALFSFMLQKKFVFPQGLK
jgi:putative flippase GtrA